MDKFSVEEINLMCVFDTSEKSRLLAEIRESMPHVYEPEIVEIMESVTDKLVHMSDAEYAEIGFFPAYESDGE